MLLYLFLDAEVQQHGTTNSGLHVVVPLHQESPGNYRLGRLVSLDDKEMQAFLSVDSRGYKATKFDL